jgi:hypothetical protein
MSTNHPARYREQAEYCRLQATKASDPKDKEPWLKIARDWLQMAEDAEVRKRRGTGGGS